MVNKLRDKPKNPLRAMCKFVDGRKDNSFYLTKVAFKGYLLDGGYYVGLTILYYRDGGGLNSIGYYDPNIKNPGSTRKIGHWKYYAENGTINKEEIFIK